MATELSVEPLSTTTTFDRDEIEILNKLLK
jgi:hypothetical protein